MYQITRKYPGSWIVQAEGLIDVIDQAFYFRANNGKAFLIISPDSTVKTERSEGAFVEIEVPEVNFGDGNIFDQEIYWMITQLLTKYLKEATKAHSIVHPPVNKSTWAS